MIDVFIVTGQGEGETDLGKHAFATMPRPGDQAVVYVEGVPTAVEVETVTHWPRPDTAGPTGKPGVAIRVKQR